MGIVRKISRLRIRDGRSGTPGAAACVAGTASDTERIRRAAGLLTAGSLLTSALLAGCGGGEEAGAAAPPPLGSPSALASGSGFAAPGLGAPSALAPGAQQAVPPGQLPTQQPTQLPIQQPAPGAVQPGQVVEELPSDMASNGVAGADCGGVLAQQPALPPPAGMRRLSWTEIGNALEDLLPAGRGGLAAAQVESELVPLREPEQLQLSETFYRAFRPVANNAGAQAASEVMGAACPTGETACLQAELSALARRAWRHNLLPEESQFLNSKLALFVEEVGPQAGYAAAVEVMLSSPRFLYLLDPGSLLADQAPDGIHRPNGDRTAGMLAATLWASVPDAQLLDSSAAGALSTPAGLGAEVQRMLQDPRARRGIQTFFRAWLGYGRLVKSFKDADLFPEYDDALREEMVADTDQTLEALFFDDAVDPTALLSSSLGFPSEGMIEVLGWDGVTPGRADMGLVGRHGIATHPAILALNSGTSDSSIISRGQYLVETLACGHIPPPPPGVDNDLDKLIEGAGRPLTNREVAELHSVSPDCAGCHAFLDPFGIAFENYDAIGAERDMADGLPIDTSVTIDGPLGLQGTFAGAEELLDALAATGAIQKCFATKFAQFIEPQQLSKAQSCALSALMTNPAGTPSSMSEFVSRFVTSPEFLNRSL